MDTSETTGSSSSTDADMTSHEPKKARGDGTTTSSASDSSDNLMSSTEDYGLEVIVTLYDELASKRNPKVTQCMEFIGVLSLNPVLNAELEAEGFDIGNENWNPRRRKAIRMHALCAIPIESGFPIIPDPNTERALFDTMMQDMRSNLAQCRSTLIDYLTHLFDGDALAAEVMLLFLLQRIHTRGIGMGGNTSVGKLSLNMIAPKLDGVTNDPHISDKLQRVIELLMPRARKFDMNIDALNKQIWQPVKGETQRK